MAAILKKFLGVNQVAEAIGSTPKTVRNWLDRKLFEPSGETASGRFEFSPYDVCVLAIVRPLVQFGVPTDEAVAIANDVLRNSAGFKAALRHAAFDAPGTFSASLLSTYLRVFKRGNAWVFDTSDDPESALSAFIYVSVGPVVRSALRNVGILKPLPETGADG
jgi:hypothetical protein